MAFVCVRASAFSSRTPLHGSESLRLAGLPRRALVVVAGRRDGTAARGVSVVSSPRLLVKATGSAAPAEGEDGEEDEGEEFEEVLSKEQLLEVWKNWDDLQMSMVVDKTDGGEDAELVLNLKQLLEEGLGNEFDIFDRLALSALVGTGMDDQDMLATYAVHSFSIWVVVANKLNPALDTKLYEGLKLCGNIIVTVALMASREHAPWKAASDLIEALDLLRRLASSGFQSPLPMDWTGRFDADQRFSYSAPAIGVEMILKRTFKMVKLDIASMLQ